MGKAQTGIKTNLNSKKDCKVMRSIEDIKRGEREREITHDKIVLVCLLRIHKVLPIEKSVLLTCN